MIIYEVRYYRGIGIDVEWCRNKAQAEKRKREISECADWVEDIVQHTVGPNKDGVVRFLNIHANSDNG